MAAFTSIALGVGALAGVASGAQQAIQGGKTADQAQSDIDGYERQEFRNLADDLKVRTEAQDFQADQTDRSLATQLDFLRQGGSFTNATAVTNQAIEAKQKISESIQNQRGRIDEAKLSEGQNIRGLVENRENADLAGLGAQLQYGNQQKAQGIQAIGSTIQNTALSAASGGFGGGGGGAETPDLSKNPFSKQYNG